MKLPRKIIMMFVKKLRVILLFICLFSITGYTQVNLYKSVWEPKPADSLDIEYYSKKRPWAAAGITFSYNIGIWAFDRFALKADYAYINFNTMKHNLISGFEWDNDQMSTNLFAHPYHGNLYFNSARSNGYNFWQSGLFALGGSAMWELFMENEVPSINDIIATPIGGIAVGEIFYRASDLVLDDRSMGWARFGREFAGFLINPSRGITRITTGDAWRVRSTSGKQFGMPLVNLSISSGIRAIELQGDIFDEGMGWATDIALEYGDKFADDHAKPYDYFNFRANLNIHTAQPVIGQLNIIGRLWGDSYETKKHFFNYGVYQHFDYYDSDTISDLSDKVPYKLGVPASFGIGGYHKRKSDIKLSFDSYAHLNLLLLSASLSDHYVVDNRDYNLGFGFGWKCGLNTAYKDRIGLSFKYEGYRMYTTKGYPPGYDLSTAVANGLNAQGDKSSAMLHVGNILIDIKLYRKLYLTLSFSGYSRYTDYKYYENVYSFSGDTRLMLTYKF